MAADVINMMLFRIGDGIVGLLKGCMLEGWRIGHSINALLASTSKTIQCVRQFITFFPICFLPSFIDCL